MRYALYDKTTGAIRQTGECCPDSLAQRHETETTGVIPNVQRGVDATHRVVMRRGQPQLEPKDASESC
jgi:hypothetical protein